MPSIRVLRWGLFALALGSAFGGLLWGEWRLTHDNFNQFLTFRHFVGTEWGMGRFPWWNPWINLGYPFAADPQSGAWYPPVWFFSMFSVYTPRILAIEWCFHVAIGGLGMVWWLQRGWKVSPAIAWTWGITFSLSGFFIGTAQILPFVIAGAWTPWVLGAFHIWMLQPSAKAAIRLSVAMAMMLLGGYPSFAYNAALILSVWWLVRKWRQPSRRAIWRDIRGLGVAAVLSASLAAGFLFDFWREVADLSRSDPGAMAHLDPGIWPPAGWLSLGLPNAASLPVESLGTDRSHINGFIGWIPWMLLAVGGWTAPRKERMWVGGLLLLAVLLALGPEGGLHPLLSRFVPGMNLFRHTAQFRVYALIVALLASAVWLDRQKDRRPLFQGLAMTFAGLSLVSMALVGLGDAPDPFALLQWGPSPASDPVDSIPTLMGAWGGRIFPIGLAWLLWSWLFPDKGRIGMLGVQVLTMIQATWLAFGTTVAVHKPFDALTHHLTERADRPWSGNPFIVAEIPAGRDIGLWRNAPMVIKQPSHQGYNPFQSASFNTFSRTEDYAALEGHPFLWIEPQTAPCSLEVVRFEPQTVEVNVTCSSSDPVELVWAQNHNRAWRVQWDGVEQSPQVWKGALMSCALPASAPNTTTLVSWRYHPGRRRWAAVWMAISWIAVGLFGLRAVARPNGMGWGTR